MLPKEIWPVSVSVPTYFQPWILGSLVPDVALQTRCFYLFLSYFFVVGSPSRARLGHYPKANIQERNYHTVFYEGRFIFKAVMDECRNLNAILNAVGLHIFELRLVSSCPNKGACPNKG